MNPEEIKQLQESNFTLLETKIENFLIKNTLFFKTKLYNEVYTKYKYFIYKIQVGKTVEEQNHIRDLLKSTSTLAEIW